MNTFFDARRGARMGKILTLLGIVSVLFVGMLFLNQTKRFDAGTDITKAATIDVSGTGEAFAIPNIATESFTVEQKGATVHEAQTVVTKKVNDALAFLKDAGIAEKDIKTTNYSAYPEYSYPTPCTGDRICAQPSAKIIGYTVSQTVTVKVRDTSKVGAIVDGLGSRGVTGLSGPDFTVEDADAVNAEARGKAIADANTKARVLARQLGVTLVRVVRFSESGGGVYPMMYAKDMASTASAPMPELPVGQNKYTSNVTITYEIQ
jgi:uncharacterized protein YggE